MMLPNHENNTSSGSWVDHIKSYMTHDTKMETSLLEVVLPDHPKKLLIGNDEVCGQLSAGNLNQIMEEFREASAQQGLSIDKIPEVMRPYPIDIIHGVENPQSSATRLRYLGSSIEGDIINITCFRNVEIDSSGNTKDARRFHSDCGLSPVYKVNLKVPKDQNIQVVLNKEHLK